MAGRDFGRAPRSREIPPRRRRYARTRTRARSLAATSISVLHSTLPTDRSSPYSAPSTSTPLRQLSTTTLNERNRPSTQTRSSRTYFTVPVVYHDDVRFRLQWIITYSPQITYASNVHRFASQFACTSGEP